MRNFFNLLLLGALAVLAPTAAARTFVHPGIDVSQEDLDRARRLVAEGREPWTGCFQALKASRYSDLNATVHERGESLRPSACNGTIGVDGRRAHDLALLYRLTDDERYADLAVRFINANSHYTTLEARGTYPLDFGKIYLLVEAAELLRDYKGWPKEDKVRFAKMLRDVFYPLLKNGDPFRFGNQGLFAFRGVLAIAIFTEDARKFDRVWRYLNGEPHAEKDEPFPSGPPNAEETPFAEDSNLHFHVRGSLGEIEDYGYDEQLRHYFYRSGQCQETSRDQGHVMAGLFQYVAIAEAFWLQGRDLYGALNCRLLFGLEWNLRYNFGAWEMKGVTENEEEVSYSNGLFYQARHRSGRWQSLRPNPEPGPNFGGPGSPREAAYAHYRHVKGVPEEKLRWLRKAIERENGENGGFETWGKAPNWFYEWSGWGTLLKRRPEGDGAEP